MLINFSLNCIFVVVKACFILASTDCSIVSFLIPGSWLDHPTESCDNRKNSIPFVLFQFACRKQIMMKIGSIGIRIMPWCFLHSVQQKCNWSMTDKCVFSIVRTEDWQVCLLKCENRTGVTVLFDFLHYINTLSYLLKMFQVTDMQSKLKSFVNFKYNEKYRYPFVIREGVRKRNILYSFASYIKGMLEKF